MRFVVNKKYKSLSEPVQNVCEKYRALIGLPECAKRIKVKEGIHFNTNWKDVSAGSINIGVKGKYISECIEVLGVLEMLQIRPYLKKDLYLILAQIPKHASMFFSDFRRVQCH